MNPSTANQIRSRRAEGKEEPNSKVRQVKKAKKEEVENRWSIDRLWNHFNEHQDSFKGQSRDDCTYALHLQKSFGDKMPSEINQLEVDRLRIDLLKKKGLAPQTVKNILSLLRRTANWGKKKSLCSGLDFHIEMPKVNNEVNEALPPELIASLLVAFEKAENQLEAKFLKMLMFTGRRSSEICRLTWNGINVEQQSMFLKETKTNRSETLPLADVLVEMLRNMERYHEMWVFPNNFGEGRKRFDAPGRKIVYEDAGLLGHYRPTYCLRHTFASTAANEDVSWHIIKELLGHKSGFRDITARYSHVSHKVLLRSVNQIAEALLNSKEEFKVNTPSSLLKNE